MPKDPVDAAPEGLDDAADVIYGGTLAEFVATRDRLAREAKAAGDRELAQAIGGLAKPTTSAWVVNALVRAAPDDVETVLELGAALRAAQEEIDPDAMRGLNQQRQELVRAVVERARTSAEAAGQRVSAAALDEVEQTIRAGMADPTAAEAVRSGRLTRPIAAAGLGPLTLGEVVALPRRAPKAPSRRTDADRAALADAQTAVDDAERALTAARLFADSAAREAAAAATELDRLRHERDALRERLEAIEGEVTDAERRAERAAAARAEAADGAEDAVRDLAQARKTLDALGR